MLLDKALRMQTFYQHERFRKFDTLTVLFINFACGLLGFFTSVYVS
jgi:hypothetical protein